MAVITNTLHGDFQHAHISTKTENDIASEYPSLDGINEPDLQEVYVTFLYRGQQESDARFILEAIEKTDFRHSKEFGYIRQELEDTLEPRKPVTILERIFG